MILDTRVHKSGNSLMMKFPPSFVKYYELENKQVCKVEDISPKEMRIILE